MGTSAAFDPFRAERRLVWLNRVARWRAQPAQALLHGGALVVLLVLLAPLLQRAAGGALVLFALTLQRAPFALATGGFMLALLLQVPALHRAQRCLDAGWWHAQPVAEAFRRRRRRATQLEASWPLLLGAPVMLYAADAGARAAAAALATFALACSVAPWLAVRWAHRQSARAALRARRADASTGSLARWQWREAEGALRGPTLAYGLLAWLLVPMDGGARALLAIGAVGLLTAALGGGWRRALGVLPRAQGWLAAQPMRGSQWLRDTLGVPATLLAFAAGAPAALLALLGVTTAIAPLLLLVLWAGSLHYAAIFAERRRPRRAGLAFALHALAGLVLLQSTPPLALLAWPLQLAWLLRRGCRP